MGAVDLGQLMLTRAGEGCAVHDLSSLHFGNCSSAPAKGWLMQGHRRAHLESVPKLPFIRNGLLKWNIHWPPVCGSESHQQNADAQSLRRGAALSVWHHQEDNEMHLYYSLHFVAGLIHGPCADLGLFTN